MSDRAVLSRSRHQKRFRSYFLESSVGIFAVMPDPASPNRWNLYIRAKRLGQYDSAEEAIRAVEDGNTGFPSWDEAAAALTDLGLFTWKTI